MELEAIRVMAQKMQDILGLSASVIGVSFRLTRHCQRRV